jgi:hypothetical protein
MALTMMCIVCCIVTQYSTEIAKHLRGPYCLFSRLKGMPSKKPACHLLLLVPCLTYFNPEGGGGAFLQNNKLSPRH